MPEKDEPTFQFTVYADVTDTTGETRSAPADDQRRLHGAAGVADRRRLADGRASRSRSRSRTQTLDGEGAEGRGRR